MTPALFPVRKSLGPGCEMHEAILIINPGSTSTKIAVWQSDKLVLQETVRHPADELAKFTNVADQFDLRLIALRTTVQEWLLPGKLSSVVGRGGPLRPLEGGTYTINEWALLANYPLNVDGVIFYILKGLA